MIKDELDWVVDIKPGVTNFLETLSKNNVSYEYDFSDKGLTKEGSKLSLGFSCYALKLNYIIYSDRFSENKYERWINYLNSYQTANTKFPENSYIDKYYLKYAKKFNLAKYSKNIVKSSVNLIKPNKYETLSLKLQNSIKAESKQAISTIFQIQGMNKYPYDEFPQTKESIEKYLHSLNWEYPWHAGAQFSALSLFTNTQITDKEKKLTNQNILKSFSTKLLDPVTGLYFKGNQKNKRELVNGAMKMITGFSWIDGPIHYPDKIIDFCLNEKVNNEGCDLVDIVYVLYECSALTNYRKKDIIKYLTSLISTIKDHYFQDIGGFSYFLDKSQTHYYGVKITEGRNTPDLHGTLLLVWAISMILEMIEYEKVSLNILKP